MKTYIIAALFEVARKTAVCMNFPSKREKTFRLPSWYIAHCTLYISYGVLLHELERIVKAKAAISESGVRIAQADTAVSAPA